MFRRSSRLLPAAAMLAAFLAVFPEVAGAQFAGVARAPRRFGPRTETVAAGDTVRRDTIPPTRLPDMKAWVDSATIAIEDARSRAGTRPTAQPPRADSAAPAGRRRRAPAPARPDSMQDGAPAPDTATTLPAVALVGAVTLLAGLLLRRRASAAQRRA